MSGANNRRLISIMHACEEAGVSRRTIYNWLAAGKLEHVRTAGGSVRIYADSLFRSDTQAPPELEETTVFQVRR